MELCRAIFEFWRSIASVQKSRNLRLLELVCQQRKTQAQAVIIQAGSNKSERMMEKSEITWNYISFDKLTSQFSCTRPISTYRWIDLYLIMASSALEKVTSPRGQSPISNMDRNRDKDGEKPKEKVAEELDLTAQEVYVLLNKSSRVSRNNRAHW